jgi:hypothetical protein
MTDKFRLAGTVKEFFSDLKNLKNVEHDLMIWQTSLRGKKKITEGKFESYQNEKDKVFINIVLNNTVSFDQKSDVFIFAKKEGILFKGKYEYCVAGKLKLIADEKFYLKEKRSVDRFFFNYTKIDLILSFVLNEKSFKEKVILKDINKKGMSFLVTNKKSKFYHTKGIVHLESIHGIELPKSIGGQIMHTSVCKKKSNVSDAKLTHVGVQFDETSALIGTVMKAMGAEVLNSKEF